jgi:hypothetical protein
VSHRLAERRSIELHRIVARRIVEDPVVLDRARARVATWLQEGGPVDAARAERWARLLDGPVDEVLRELVLDTPDACDLRQVTPFAGVVDSRERWRILREVG